MVAEAPPLAIAAPPVVAPAPAPIRTAPLAPTPAPAAAIVPTPTFSIPTVGEIYIGTNAVVTGVTIDVFQNVPVEMTVEMLQVDTFSNAGNSIATMDTGNRWATNQWGSCYCDTGTTSKKFRLTAKMVANSWAYGSQSAWDVQTTYVTAKWTTNVNTNRWRIHAGTWGGTGCYLTPEDYPLSRVDEFRKKLRENMTPEIVTKNRDLWGIALTEQEIRARTLLLELIGEADFRRYLRRGFIMVVGRSGTLYKISGGNTMIVSYVRNIHGRFEACEKFCVQFKEYNLPFTDGIIMRKLLVESDEFQLRKVANVFQINKVDKALPMVAVAG